MDDELMKYLEKTWRYSNHKKYHKYFNEWVENITEDQIHHFRIMMIKKNIYEC